MNAKDVIDAAHVAWCSPHGQDYRLADVILAALGDEGWRVVKLKWAGGVTETKTTWIITEEETPDA